MKPSPASFFFIAVIIIGGGLSAIATTDFWRGFGFGLVLTGAVAAGWTMAVGRKPPAAPSA